MAHIDIGQNSVLNLYSDVEVSDGLQVAFSSAAAQYNYFSKRLVKQYTGMSYVYRNGVVKIQDTPQVVARANYISFNNPSFESKPIYARITDYQYVNNATVKITYAIDWFQTFMFDVSYRSCQIQREHLSDADWAKAVANPWRHDILELETGENFHFTEDDRPQISTKERVHYLQCPDDSTDCYVMLALSPFSFDVTPPEDIDPDNPPRTPEDDLGTWLRLFTFHNIDTALADDDFNQIVVRADDVRDGLPAALNIYIFKINVPYQSIFTGMNDSWQVPKMMIDGVLDDLTAMGRTSQIVALYYAPKATVRAFLGDSDTAKNIFSVDNINARTCIASNPKMKRFPFSYLTVESPSGNRKEFHYEKFADPTNQIDFYLLGSFNGFPFLSLVPYNYGQGNPSAGGVFDKTGFNITERLDYAEVPQLSYTTDGFLSYISSQYQQAQVNQSTPVQLARMGEFMGGAATAAASLAPTLAGGALNGLTASGALSDTRPVGAGMAALGSTLSNVSQGDNSKAGAAAGAAMMAHAVASNLSDANVRSAMGANIGLGSPIYNFDTERSLYDNDIYHAGTAGGFPAYKLARFYYQFYFKTLTPAWTEIVDNYFNAFGYNSGRIGIPRIVNFIHGGGDQPHFVTYDGAPTTYVKTTDCHVISTMMPVSLDIEALFNAGCRFIKGDGR